MPIIFCGMDVHEDTVVVAVLPEGAGEPSRVVRLINDDRKLKRFFSRLAKEGEVRACYEASGSGYVLQRSMSNWGHECEIIAPSLIPQRPGDQRKHDRKDATMLARLYRAGELATEIGDFRRFHRASQLMAYLGLVPSEHSSGSRERKGSITKGGNSYCRHVLVQAAWHCRYRPHVSKVLAARQKGQPPDVVTHAWKAQLRLYRSYRRFAYRKPHQVAVVAMARELVGFIWAALRDLPPAGQQTA